MLNFAPFASPNRTADAIHTPILANPFQKTAICVIPSSQDSDPRALRQWRNIASPRNGFVRKTIRTRHLQLALLLETLGFLNKDARFRY